MSNEGFSPRGTSFPSFLASSQAFCSANRSPWKRALPFVIPTRISCHAALDKAACAPFGEERRIKTANATNPDRKSGERLEEGDER
jgi:hypothetical protein